MSLRRSALMMKVPYYTTISGARASVEGIEAVRQGQLEVGSLQWYRSEAGQVGKAN